MRNKAVPRTANPSRVLVVGGRSDSIRRDLKMAGHIVDGSSDSASANGTYAVVLVDSDQAAAVRQKFAKAIVIVRSGDKQADFSSVEDHVARHPTKVLVARKPDDSKSDRVPVEIGPDRKDPRFVGGMPSQPPTLPPAPVLPPVAARVTTAPTRVETPSKARPEAKAVVAAELHQEILFGLGSAKVANAQALSRAVTWLGANAAGSVTLVGHADPSGSSEGNMALSQSRAEAVRDFLVGKGVDVSRIQVKALGDTQLKYGKSDGRNRRVAIDATP